MASSKSREELAIRLVLAVKRLRARLRETWPSPVQSLPTSQLAILKRLRDDGATTAATLAVAEHVSQQAIAQHVAALRDAGLVKTAPDPNDGRKALISITKNGLKLFDAAAESRNAWLMRAIASQVPAKEQAALAKAIELLERLASADVGAD
ncbi:MAG: MarR family winged helix-turn-helix transcriptional regulator [Gemmatimonadaceae bacterium]